MTTERDRTKKLTTADLRYMNLPEQYWRREDCSLAGVPQSVRREVRSYVRRVDEALASGMGLLLSGSRGVGKTAIAAIVCKAARTSLRSCLFVTVWDLREMIRARVTFDPDTSMMTRARDVDVLVLDDFRAEEADARFLSLREIEGLVSSRASRQRITVITTRLTPQEIKQGMGGLGDVVRAHLLPLVVSGPDQRVERARKIRDQLLKGGED